MINIQEYIEKLTENLKDSFGQRLVYVGLQGSYLRGEATDSSDIDIMAVIDRLAPEDLAKYHSIIKSMEHFDRSCGFICGREDLALWNPLEIFHLLGSTRDHFGKLSDIVPAYTETDIRNFIKLGIGNLYHEICHRRVHSNAPTNLSALAGSYKAAFFILQDLHYLKTGEFVCCKAELLEKLSGKDKAVLVHSAELAKGGCADFEESFELLFSWCKETLVHLG